MSTDVMQDTCEHGLSAALCAGPGHYPADDRSYYPAATQSEAHAEWHRNAGVPMGQPGCPQDACDGDYGWGDDELSPAELAEVEAQADAGNGFGWEAPHPFGGDEPPF